MQLIANCQIRNRMIPRHHADRLLEACIAATGLQATDICLNFTPVVQQVGRQFELILQVFLPAGMPDQEAEAIAGALPGIMAQHLSLREADIWLTLTRTQTPHDTAH